MSNVPVGRIKRQNMPPSIPPISWAEPLFLPVASKEKENALNKENTTRITPPPLPAAYLSSLKKEQKKDDEARIDFQKIKKYFSDRFNSAMFLVRFSAAMSCFAFILVLLHWVFGSNIKDVENKIDKSVSVQMATSEKIDHLKKVSVDNFDGMGRKISDLGDAQMRSFREVNDNLEHSRNMSNNQFDELKQTIENEGRKNRYNTGRIADDLAKLSEAYENMPAAAVKVRVVRQHEEK